MFPEKAMYPFRYAIANHELGTIWFPCHQGFESLATTRGAACALFGLRCAVDRLDDEAR